MEPTSQPPSPPPAYSAGSEPSSDESQHRTGFAFYDRRTGQRVGMASVSTLGYAERELVHYRERDARGQRPDIHDLIPHIGIVELTAETWGSRPGDVIAPGPSYVLAGVAEVADILGVTKQRVDQLRQAGRLPEPVAVLAATPVWDRAAVESYAATRCRCGYRLNHAATCPAAVTPSQADRQPDAPLSTDSAPETSVDP